MDERSAGYLEGATVDFMVDGLGKAGFVFHNPNALRGLDAAESVPLE